MNYFCVRRELLPAGDGKKDSLSFDRDQTCKMEYYKAEEDGSRTSRRLHSQPTKTSAPPCRPVFPEDRKNRNCKEFTKGAAGCSRPRRYLSEPTDSIVQGELAHGEGVEEGGRDDLPSSRPFYLDDPRNAEKFDFYLAVPEKDLETFGMPFCDLVERCMSMKPCLSIRDIMPGQPKFEAMAHTLETRCNGKIVFVISENFSSSEECGFLVHFAKTLDPDAMSAKLIPLEIDKGVKLPRVLEGLTTINYNAAMREKWLGRRLWEAVHGTQAKQSKGLWSRIRSISSPS